MVYKIRNKGFANFTPGLTPRMHPAKKTKTNMDLTTTVSLQTHITRFTGLRIMHNYRNISRACKQFLMGDKVLEQLMILTIREHFFAPMYYQTPIENTFYMGRALADLSDRHYGLFANNQHPIQLATYEQYNKFLRSVHDEADREQREQVGERLEEVASERSALLNQKEGESLGVDDLSDIYMQVMAEYRNKSNMSL
jgi:hypothetical protein